MKAETSLPNVVFIFCGMGTGWRGMGREMMASFADFRQTVQDIDTALRQYVPWSLTERLQAADDVTDPVFGPIGIFTCQVGSQGVISPPVWDWLLNLIALLWDLSSDLCRFHEKEYIYIRTKSILVT